MHKDFLGGISTYFKNLFEGDFREASALKSKCDILTPTQFKIFLEWLYSRRLVDRDGNEDEHLSDCDLPYLQQFADMYQIESLRRDTFLAFCGKQRPDTSAAPHPYDVNLTFELFPKDSQWCRFLVDIYAWDVFNDGMSQDGRLDFPDELRLLSPEFIWRVLWVKSTEGRT